MSINVVGIYSLPPQEFIDTDTFLFFDAPGNDVLSRSDGTVEGTFQLVNFGEDFSNGDLRLDISTTINNNLFFVGLEDEFGAEPWISDGTTEGTRVLKDINPNGSSNPFNFFALNDTFLFTADDGVNGRALWRSDGTEVGTELVRIFEGRREAFDALVLGDTANVLGDSLYFTFPGFGDDDGIGLWRSDGTPEGTQLVAEDLLAGRLTTVDDKLFFVNFADSEEFTSQAADAELWITDGTEEGTQLVKDIAVAPENSVFPQSSLPENLTDVNGTLFFTADDGVNGRELWRSDGTAEGTQLVKDIRPEERFSGTAVNLGSEPEDLINVNGTLFFTADDGVNGRELWKSDGTTEGTQLVKVIAETDESTGFTDLRAGQFVNAGGTLYFLVRNSFSNDLWQSDGTEAGTFQIDTELDTFTFEPEEQVLRDTFPNNQQTGFLRPTGTAEFNDQLYITGLNSGVGAFEVPTQAFALATLSDEENSNQEQTNSEEINSGETVYRFFRPDIGVHFYTASEVERDAVLELSGFDFEGASYQSVDPLSGSPEPLPVYRFLNQDTGVHLYTVSEIERDAVEELANYSFEGEAFYAYAEPIEGAIPIHRFFNQNIGAHFYTPSEAEREAIETGLPDYDYESIAYYALPLETAELSGL